MHASYLRLLELNLLWYTCYYAPYIAPDNMAENEREKKK